MTDAQQGGHIILSGCRGGWSLATNVGGVQQLSDQFVQILKIDPQQRPQQQQQPCGALIDL